MAASPGSQESALVGLATAALATPIGLSAALAYRAMTRLRGVFLLVILSAMFVPGTIEGLGLSATLRVVGLAPSWVTIAIGHLLWTLPFAAVVSLIGLSAVRPSTIASARDLGAGPIRAFVDITLPLMRTNLVSSFVFAFLLFTERAGARLLPGRSPEHASALYVRRDEFGCLADHLRIFRRDHRHLGRSRRPGLCRPSGAAEPAVGALAETQERRQEARSCAGILDEELERERLRQRAGVGNPPAVSVNREGAVGRLSRIIRHFNTESQPLETVHHRLRVLAPESTA